MKNKQQSYNASSKIRVSGGDRMNRRKGGLPIDFENRASLPSLARGRKRTAGHRDRSLDLRDDDRPLARSGQGWRSTTIDAVPVKRRRFRITRSAFTEPVHLDKSSSRLRNRFSDFFVLGGVPAPKRRRDDDIAIHRNRMVFLAFTACLAVYVMYKLLVSP